MRNGIVIIWQPKIGNQYFIHVNNNVNSKSQSQASRLLSMPNSLLMKLNLSSHKGFVKISANWLFVSTNSRTTSPFNTWTRIKWCLMFICLVLEYCIGFLVKLIALILSHLIGMWSRDTLKSLNYCLIQSIWL